MVCYRAIQFDSSGRRVGTTTFSAIDDNAARTTALVFQQMGEWPKMQLWTDREILFDGAAPVRATERAA